MPSSAFSVVALALPVLASAQGGRGSPPRARLTTGMAAPALEIEKWIKGGPVTGFEKGKAYVIEFWATWCPPCIASMPHLSALQRQYGESVTIVGVTSLDPRNPLDKVEKMVADKGREIAYAIAWDEGRATSAAFLEASGQKGIPCSFVVDRSGRIAYIGHPLFLDEPLAEIQAGTWDLAKDPAQLAADQQAFFDLHGTAGSDPKGTLERLGAFEGRHPALSSLTDPLRFELGLSVADYPDAYATGARMVERAIAARDAAQLNQVAWTIVDPGRTLAQRDLVLAERAAAKAVELTGSRDPTPLDTLARVHATKGDLARAIELQAQAVAVAPAKRKAGLGRTLEEYRTRAAGE